MAAQFSDLTKFWVIFDTCTVRDYYLDVHKLLAIPTNGTLRYNYKEKYVSPQAVAASLNPTTAPKFALLLYAQRIGFRQGDPTPPTGTIFREMLWIPTRIVEMLCIPPRDGETFNYDFKMVRYPCFDRQAMMRILAPLIQRKEIPFNKWVALSSELKALGDLHQGQDRTNWGSIVDEFHRPESQFSSDVFWRLVGPTKGPKSTLVAPRYDRLTDAGTLRLVKSVYDLEEGQNHSFEIVSAGPQPLPGAVQYSVRCTSTNPQNVDVVGSGVVSLRHQAADSVQFVGKIVEEIADHGGSLRFETEPKPPTWPTGPELELMVAVVKSKTRIVVGFVIGLLGLALGVYGGEKIKSSLVTGLVCVAIGIILVVVSGLLISRKLNLKT